MHWLDSTLLGLIILGAGFGFVSGLLWQVARVASLGLALWACLFFHAEAVQIVQEYLLRDADPQLTNGIAYAGAFLAVYLILMLVTRVVRTMMQASGFAWMDRLLGASLGAAKTAAILGGVCLMMTRASQPSLREWTERSSLAPVLASCAETALTMIPDDYKIGVADNLAHLRSRVDSANQPQ